MNVSPASIVSSVLKSIDRYKHYYNLNSVLDIGAGRGIYGYYIRAYYDNFNKPKIQLDAVEPKPPKILYDIYSNVIEARVEDVLKNLPNYDIILALHVLEHLKKPNALKVLKLARSKADIVIFGVPSYSKSGGLKDDDGVESHKCFFSDDDIYEMGGVEINIKSNCRTYEFPRESIIKGVKSPHEPQTPIITMSNE